MEGKKEKSEMDLKTIGVSGIGGAGLVALLFTFQNQGIDLIKQNAQVQSQVVVEKTIANTTRISKLEENVSNLNDKIDRGFDSLRNQLRDETTKLSDILRISSADRITKTEHTAYSQSMDIRLRRVEDLIGDIKKKDK